MPSEAAAAETQAERLFQPAKIARLGTPRATRAEARAKLVHTTSGGRCT